MPTGPRTGTALAMAGALLVLAPPPGRPAPVVAAPGRLGSQPRDPVLAARLPGDQLADSACTYRSRANWSSRRNDPRPATWNVVPFSQNSSTLRAGSR